MTSAEPARTIPYSPDIGWKVVWQRLGMGLTFKRIATRLQIGVGTAIDSILSMVQLTDYTRGMHKAVKLHHLNGKQDHWHVSWMSCMNYLSLD